MASGSDIATAEARRIAALQAFAFRQGEKHNINAQQPFESSLATAGPYETTSRPPAQSRDATTSSRYFTAGPSNGTVLVPNSSPIAQDSRYQPYQPYQYSPDAQVIPGLIHHNSWSQRSRGLVDPLSGPSGFVASTSTNNANVTRPKPATNRRMIYDDDESENERPRKKPNQNQSNSSDLPDVHIPSSPTSPEVFRPGQKRKLAHSKASITSSPQSSEESLPDAQSLLAGPSKARIIRGQRPEKVDDKLVKFRMVNNWLTNEVVDAVYHSCNGDIRAATNILIHPDFSASAYRPASSSATATPETSRVVGKVNGIDEEREAARAAAKEKAAKSFIYRKRADLDHPSPSPSATPSSSAPIDPEISPAQPRPSRTKPRKRVIDSGSEVDSDGVEIVGSSKRADVVGVDYFERKALESFNTLGSDALRELTGCTPEQAEKIMSLRPFGSVDDIERRLHQGKKKAGPAGISPRMFQECVDIYEGYGTVDQILLNCERIGKELKKAIAGWSGKDKGKSRAGSLATSRASSVLDDDATDDGALNLVSLSSAMSANGFINKPPSILAEGVQLKDYQLIGINWLHLLYSKRLSCILADEMGLGKTIQVISFFALLHERGCKGPHLIVVPSSTLENWCREFERFAPTLNIQTYYAGKEERPQLREHLLDSCIGKPIRKGGRCWEVLITTYNLAVGDERDRKFLRKINWATCVFDEGHILKNFQSQRYIALTRISARWKVLLTGTPLQNNLQELVSLMNFILPDQFAESMESMRAIFKVKGDLKFSLLAEERVSRAKRMMTPFVLRRRKDQVLKDLPSKSERIEWCEMTPLQRSIYRDAMQRSRKTILEVAEAESKETSSADAPNGSGGKKVNGSKVQQKKGRGNLRAKDKMYLENSSNVLMDLRKAASHPMLFRTQFTDAMLTSITRLLMKEPDFKKRGAISDYVKEDMEVMTDAELQAFCNMYKSTQRFLLDGDCYLQAGKVKAMLELLSTYKAEGRKCLIFSQFTQILDILQAILKQKSIKYLVLTGSTAVDVRQGLVDEFTEDLSIPVFLLSTRAGGMGINLTAASVVILFDQDFNPHNDRQAADRAYRIGQKRDVQIVKLITRGTIEEDMLRLGETKLALDEAVAGDTDTDADAGGGEGKAEKIMRTSLMDTLRKQFEEEANQMPEVVSVEPNIMGIKTPKKAGSSAKADAPTKKAETPKKSTTPKKAGTRPIVIDSDSDVSELTDIEVS